MRRKLFYQVKQYRTLVVGSILPIMFMFLLVQALAAQPIVTAADVTEAQHGATVQNALSGNNFGAQAVAGVVFSDTTSVEPITNTGNVTGSDSLVSDDAVIAATDAVTQYIYFPIIFKPAPTPNLLSVSSPVSLNTNTFRLTANWSNVGSGQYELQVAKLPDFSDAQSYNVGNATSKAVDHNASHNFEYYHRVRFITDNGVVSGWSNVIKQYGVYMDHFDDPNSGWMIRREDTDDTDNYSYYENNNFVLKLKGRWDFAIGGPMVKVPWESYRIETSIRFDPGVDNLHSYGLIWGGDWDHGGVCPDASMTSCLNHYYRLNIIWYGSPSSLRNQIKRIDYHDSENGAGRGVELAGYYDTGVGAPSGDWKTWAVEYYKDGTIKVFVNGALARTAKDATFAGAGTYFGVLATSNEYAGTEIWTDWLRVSPLP
ncbi:MAG: hypothetical protein IAF02_11130 [Anaerolineae bacterium]|nr:hypothetical protein [Anaerolineae bacterium]